MTAHPKFGAGNANNHCVFDDLPEQSSWRPPCSGGPRRSSRLPCRWLAWRATSLASSRAFKDLAVVIRHFRDCRYCRHIGSVEGRRHIGRVISPDLLASCCFQSEDIVVAGCNNITPLTTSGVISIAMFGSLTPVWKIHTGLSRATFSGLIWSTS